MCAYIFGFRSGEILGVMVEVVCAIEDDMDRTREWRSRYLEQLEDTLASLGLELRPINVDYAAYELTRENHSIMHTGLRYSKLCDYLYKHREDERKSLASTTEAAGG